MTPAMRQAIVAGAFGVLCALTVSFAVSALTRSPIVLTTPAATVTTTGGGTAFQTGIFTTGEGTVSLRPDTAFIEAGVEAQASTAGAAQKAVAALASKLIAKAKGLGIADKDINTGAYSVGPTYSNDGRTITGFLASEQLALKWHNVDTTGSAVDALVQDGGASRISVGFGLGDPTNAQAQARILAIGAARARAQAMAKAAGLQLGQIIRIVDVTTSGPVPMAGYAKAAADASGSQLPVGQMDVMVSVEVDFAIS